MIEGFFFLQTFSTDHVFWCATKWMLMQLFISHYDKAPSIKAVPFLISLHNRPKTVETFCTCNLTDAKLSSTSIKNSEFLERQQLLLHLKISIGKVPLELKLFQAKNRFTKQQFLSNFLQFAGFWWFCCKSSFSSCVFFSGTNTSILNKNLTFTFPESYIYTT